MTYEPQAGDHIYRTDHTPIILIHLTAATAKWEKEGKLNTQPRIHFDNLLEKTLQQPDCTVLRDGKKIYPNPVEKCLKDLADACKPLAEKYAEDEVKRAKEVYDKLAVGVSGSHNTHARLAPSSSKTWTNCTIAPAYVEANKHLVPADTGSEWADEGMRAHDFAADILLNKTKLEDIPMEMRDPVGEYVAHCLSLVPAGTSYQVEVSVPLFYQRDQKGTCDFAIVTDERVTIRDYKHGMGVQVMSADNPQLAIYAYSLIKDLEDVYDFEDDTMIDLKVVQPRHRLSEEDEAWVLPLSQFRDYCNKIALKAQDATAAVTAVKAHIPPRKANEEPYHPDEIRNRVSDAVEFLPQDGDHGSCRWCKAKSFCGVRHAEATVDHDTSALLALMPDLTKEENKAPVEQRIDNVLDMELVQDEIIPQHGDTLRLDYLIQVWRNKKKIEKFLGDVEEYLEALAKERPLPGLKWVEGRQGNRAWGNEGEADTFLKGQKLKQEERYTFKLKTPTQIEALLKEKIEKSTRTKNRFDQLVTRSNGKPVLVSEDDKRPALPSPGDVMPDLTADEDI